VAVEPDLGNLMSESFADLFEESLNDLDMKQGSIVTGTVVDIDSDWVIVNAGLKSEAVIPRSQFLDDKGELEVVVGQEVLVALEAVEDGFGETKLSREKAKRAESWKELEKAFEAQEVVTGVINGKVKGGFTVDVATIRAFLPGSLVDVRPVRDTAHLEGKELEFKVIKLDQKRNNVVVSRRAVLETANSQERDELLANLQEGQEVAGIVKNLTDYGAFVDLGGVDGLLHITDMAWKRIKHPSEIVNVGDEIQVKVLKFDRERNRVSLGLKQLGEDPWVAIKTNKNIHPSKVVQVGDEVEVMILDIDEERRRISLGVKQCQVNPWEEFSGKCEKGDKISGKIKSITDFGIFIGLDGGIDGLVHLSDISWNETGEEAVRNYKKGDELETIVLSIDPERERISLGVKQLESDPFNEYVAENDKGSVIKGKVISVEAKAAIVELAEGVEATLKASEISKDRVEDARNALKEGEELEAKIIVVDRKNRTIALSIKSKDEVEEKEAVKAHSQKAAPEAAGPTTIGDLIKEQLKSKND